MHGVKPMSWIAAVLACEGAGGPHFESPYSTAAIHGSPR